MSTFYAEPFDQKVALCQSPSGWQKGSPDMCRCNDCGFLAHWLDLRPHDATGAEKQRIFEARWQGWFEQGRTEPGRNKRE